MTIADQKSATRESRGEGGSEKPRSIPRPYRFSPPRRNRKPIIDRPRLLASLDGRFERRLTFIQAGAGFGKTTLLAEAIDLNLEDSAGLDIWLGLGPQDDREAELAAGLMRAIDGESGDNAGFEKIVNAIWKSSPLDVALVLDDAHHLRPGGSGARLIEEILNGLPENGHLVLASREPPTFPIARLLASGEACILEESELAFDASERSRFLGDRGARTASEDWGGWPALLELAVSTGTDRIGDFLWEEVLEELDPATRQALARMAPLDWIDAGRIENVAGHTARTADLLAGLPLMSHDADGASRLHSLWRPFLERIDPGWSDAEFEDAIVYLCRQGDFREAIQMCAHFARPDKIVDAVRAMTGIFRWARLGPLETETALLILPPEIRDAPEGQFLEGLVLLHKEPASAFPFLNNARIGFMEKADTELELTALVVLGILAFFGVNAAILRHLMERSRQIEHPARERVDALARANIALLEARPQEALEEIEAARAKGGDGAGLADATAAIAALDAGRPALALEIIHAGLPEASSLAHSSLQNSLHEALWLSGEMNDDMLAEHDAGLSSETAGHRHNTTVFHAVLAYQNAALGRRKAALNHLERAKDLFEATLGGRAEMAIAAAAAAYQALEGHEGKAGDAISASLDRHPAETRVHRHTLRAAPLIWVLAPSSRAEIDQWPSGPCFELGLEAARALVAFRETGETEKAGALDWSAHASFRIFFVPRMVLELAIAALAAGNHEAAPIARALAGRHRDALRHIAQQTAKGSERPASGLRKIVKDLLASVPAEPSEALTIEVLGPLRIKRAGAPIEDPQLRRSKVRALIHYLVTHRRARRSEISDALWPEMDAPTAANNLRVNLSHLIRLFEPDRKTGEPSYFFDLEGDWIELRRVELLRIDSELFEADLARAWQLDRAGEPARALIAFRQGLERYRAEYLVDAASPELGALERTRLQSHFVSAAIRSANLLLGQGDFEDALEISQQVLEIDDLQEAAYRIQARVYFRREDRTSARAVLQSGIDRLAEANLTPDPEFLRLLRRTGS